MQISGPFTSTSSTALNQRADIADRLQRDVPRPPNRSSNDQRRNASLEELQARYDDLQRSQVESAPETFTVDQRPPLEQDGVSRNTQRAIQTFLDNTPSAEQQLGIELVGVDTFA